MAETGMLTSLDALAVDIKREHAEVAAFQVLNGCRAIRSFSVCHNSHYAVTSTASETRPLPAINPALRTLHRSSWPGKPAATAGVLALTLGRLTPPELFSRKCEGSHSAVCQAVACYNFWPPRVGQAEAEPRQHVRTAR